MTAIQDYSDVFHTPAFVAGFSCRNHHSHHPDDRERLTLELGLNPKHLVIPQQVHSATVAWVNDPGYLTKTDGIITVNKQLVLSIQVADCIPVFLGDGNTGWGLVHAGWRGLVAGILPNAIRKMISKGSHSKNITVLLGPAICSKHFEIGEDIKQQFDPQFVSYRENRLFVDLKGIARNQLVKEGIPENQIIVHSGCTWEDEDRYYSYRREGQAAGRMIAIMGWKHS
ncbi:MAG: peptidoglycan editing factor PgeF [FCB group bacterium]|nr:peptidoglycan editing factor PgeF [FCB group bacterium]